MADAPKWFLATAAFVYATGFLVVFTFFSSLGIREAGTEFFKVKYVHVGILCLILPALGGMTALGLSYLSHWQSHSPSQREATGVAPPPSGTSNKGYGTGLADSRPLSSEADRTGGMAVPPPDSRATPNRGRAKDEGGYGAIPVYLPSVVLALNMIGTFYVYVMFVSAGYLRMKAHLLPILLFSTLLVIILLRYLPSHQISEWLTIFIGRTPNHTKKLSPSPYFIGLAVRVVLCLIVVFPLDRYSFEGFGPTLWEIFSGNKRHISGGGYVFLLLILITVWLYWRVSYRSRAIRDPKMKAALWTSACPIIFVLFYLCVLTFAYSVYPYIPAERGGGSYVESPPVVLRFDARVGTDTLPTRLISAGLTSRPVLIIEETSATIYVADPQDSGGPEEWRRGARPNVVAVRRDMVNSVEYQLPTQ